MTTHDYCQRFASVVVAEGSVGGIVQGHDAHNLSHHLERLVSTSTIQYKTLLDLHRAIHTRVATNLAAAKGEAPHCQFNYSQL